MSGDYIGALVLAALAALACLPTVRAWDARAEERRRERDGAAFRAQLAAMTAEEERAWDEYVRQAPGFDETPIWTATAAYIAEHQAADLDREWAEMNGDAS